VLRSQDSVLKPIAIGAVSSLKSKGASAKFARELAALAPSEQVLLIDALAARRDAAARTAILSSLAGGDSSVRLAAINAVGRLEDAGAVPALARTLEGAKTAEERAALERAFASLRGAEATDHALVAELARASQTAKPTLMAALARRGNRVAVPALLAEAGSPNAATAKAAFVALGKVAAQPDLAACLDRLAGLRAAEIRPDAEAALGPALLQVEDTSRRGGMVLAALGRASGPEARGSLVRLLPLCPEPGAFAALKSACGDVDPRVRETALRALTTWPDSLAWASLVELLRQPPSDAHRALAFRALVRLAGEENAHPSATLFERYRDLLGNAKNDDDRKLVLGALGGAAHPDALGLALPLLDHAGVRAEAQAAVKRIAESIKDQHPRAAQDALQKLK
jgi:hypothetical protein